MNGAGFQIVTVGASAGGVETLQTLLRHLPVDFPLPVVIVLHRTPRAGDLLTKILGRVSSLPVHDATEGGELQKGVVYIASPHAHLVVTEAHTFAYQDGRKVSHTRSAVDPLFESAAHVYGPGTIAVVLTGRGTNGARGARAVHDAGGTVIAEDPFSALHGTMPEEAIRAGGADYVLPLRSIPAALMQLARTGTYVREPAGDRTIVAQG
jgi:two-component system chemotaxis response regulator CheB